MKKLVLVIFIVALLSSGFTYKEETQDSFDLNSLIDYQKKYVGEEMEVCSSSSSKTYMDYKAITSTTSVQYRYIREHMSVDPETGLLIDEEGFIGVALGSYFGDIADRFYITLDTGVVLPVIMVDSKDDRHVSGGCEHLKDGSVLEFVIDTGIAAEYFGRYSNGYILQGNFNNFRLFNGCISKVEKVTDELNSDYITYFENAEEEINTDIFQYASGY